MQKWLALTLSIAIIFTFSIPAVAVDSLELSEGNDLVNFTVSEGDSFPLDTEDMPIFSIDDSGNIVMSTDAEPYMTSDSLEGQIEIVILEEYDLDENALGEDIHSSESLPATSEEVADDEALSNAEEGVQSVASLPDIRVRNIVENNPLDEPYPVQVNIPFKVQIENVGSTSVRNIPLSFYRDNQLVGTSTVTTTIQPGTGIYLGFAMHSSTSGSHSVKCAANVNQTISESNYSNNSTSSSFQWEYWPNPVAYGISGNRGASFPVMEPVEFTCLIANIGTETATNVPFKIYGASNGATTLLNHQTIPSIEPGVAKVYTMTSNFKKMIEEYEIRIEVSPIAGDYHLADNTLSEYFEVHPDISAFAGKWDDTSISTRISTDALDYFLNHCDLIQSEIGSAIKDWNGISNAVHFESLTYNENNNDDIYDLDLELASVNGEFGAYATMYKLDASGSKVEASYNDTCTYEYATISFNSDAFHYWDKSMEAWTVRHEVGHVLGLAHPFDVGCKCLSQTVMGYPDQDNSGFYKTMTWHDEYNILDKYG